jgi:hypothetical protein
MSDFKIINANILTLYQYIGSILDEKLIFITKQTVFQEFPANNVREFAGKMTAGHCE